MLGSFQRVSGLSFQGLGDSMQNETLAQSFVRYVHEDLRQIKQPHFDIAFRLNEAKRFNYPVELGYKDIYELAEVEFGFKRSTTAAYIAVSEKFMYGKFLFEHWQPFSFSQLVEMLPMQDYDRRQLKPDMTIKQIREWRRDHKFVVLENGDCVLYGELSDKQRHEYDDYKARQKEEKKAVPTSGQFDECCREQFILVLSCHLENAYRKSLTPAGKPDFCNFARILLEQGLVKL